MLMPADADMSDSELRDYATEIPTTAVEDMGTTDLFRDHFIGILSHDLRNPLGAITAVRLSWRSLRIIRSPADGS
jgi:signal transduction histidine kinase